MKANELMIGDWVYVSKDFTQKYHKIRALSNNEDAVLRGIYVNEYGVENNSIFSPNDTEPIPLTPEILEKNGFVLERYCGNVMSGKWWTRNDFVIHENMNDSVGKNNFKYKYVHQLQHALRLCGIEKEIEL